MASTGDPNPTPTEPTTEPTNAGLIKSDLFRFVTIRTPELIEEEEVENSFVKLSNPILVEKSIFLKAISAATSETSRRDILHTTANGFTAGSLMSREVVKDYVGLDFYNFSTWLTGNRSTLDVEETIGQISLVKTSLNDEQRLVIWDNLFYQITTYASGYVRDVLFSVLIADSFIQKVKTVDKSDKAYQKLAQSRVVVPTELFKNEAVIDSSGVKNTVNTKTLDKELKVLVLKDDLEHYESIKKEVQNAASTYDENNRGTYELAFDKHNQLVADLYKKADVKERSFYDAVSGEKKTISEYVNLNIPKFEYRAKAELDKEVLLKAVSVATYNFINDVSKENNYSSFKEINDHLENEIGTATEELFENTDLNQTVVNYNGALVPISGEPIEANTFSIGGSQISGPTLLFTTDFEDAYVISGNYKIVFNDGTVIDGTVYDDAIANNRLSIKLADDTININGKLNFSLAGEFVLNNDRKVRVEGDARIIRRRIGFGYRYFVKGNGVFQLEGIGGSDDGDSNDNTNDTIAYIPSGFGIKRLGIADYRKVEQTVCCYVPGEVSHIENIMAREYKEKETRRLRRKEDTTTISSEQETERLTDTTSTDRFEMNQEVASIIAKDQQIGASTEFNYDAKAYSFSAGADFATATTSEESNNQSVTYAKDVTERALEKVVTKTKEERIIKITEEFEEKNTHGFDNRAGDKHISGVYRWVDKIYKNQVLNYGKRLMYEFMIPEPSAFHNLAISGVNDSTDGELIKPVDPRTVDGSLNLKDYTKIMPSTYSHWAGVYNAEIKSMPSETFNVTKGFNGSYESTGYYTSGNGVIAIPEGYEVVHARASLAFDFHPGGIEASGVSINIGDKYFNLQFFPHFNFQDIYFDVRGIQKELAVAYKAFDCGTFSMSVVAKCQLTTAAKTQWQIDTFNTIIKAYENKLAEYNSRATEIQDFGVNPGFYRQIENMVLRKNCIAYLVSHERMGIDFVENRTVLEDINADFQNAELETYAARVKFFEQAFEWNIMSYNFYPFYWADKSKWKDMYNVTEFNDPLHRSFLQSGMARVVVTVRPGFVEVVNWYMATGQIWNGGQVPTMDDDLFLSIVEELQNPEFSIEETWETRVPTSLTVIQAGSIGLNVQGLPCNTDCDDFRLFDSDGAEIFDADGNPFTNPIEQTDAQVGESSEETTDTTGDA